MRNRVVGLVVVICAIAVSALAVNSLMQDNSPHLTFQKRTTTWLEKNDQVKLNGVKIGQIEKISISGGVTKITARIERGIQIPKNSIASESSAGLLGEKLIQIESNGPNGDFYMPNDEINLFDPTESNNNALAHIFTAPEKIDTAIAILRRIEANQMQAQTK